MTPSPEWDQLTHADVVRAIEEYDRLGAERFFSEHGFGPTTTYDLIWEKREYPPKAILGTAYELATGRRLAPGDFEGALDLAPLCRTRQFMPRPLRLHPQLKRNVLSRKRLGAFPDRDLTGKRQIGETKQILVLDKHAVQ